MIPPNPEFGNRLMTGKRVEELGKELECKIEIMGQTISNDRISIQGRARYKNFETVAAMLSVSPFLRQKISPTDLAHYDRIVADARAIWLAMQIRKPTGQKIINAILRVSPL